MVVELGGEVGLLLFTPEAACGLSNNIMHKIISTTKSYSYHSLSGGSTSWFD